MKRLAIIISILLVCGATISAQKDAKAKDVLEKSQKAFAGAGGMSVSFTMNIKDPKARVTESFDGKILLKDNKFYLTSPDAETWFDGKTQWTYMKGTEEVNITEPDEKSAQFMSPAVIFSIYKKGCNYRYLGESTDNKNRMVQSVELLPLKGDIKKIMLQVNKTDFIPVYFQIFYANGTENIIYIQKYQTRVNHPDNVFVYSKFKYPKATEVDLR